MPINNWNFYRSFSTGADLKAWNSENPQVLHSSHPAMYQNVPQCLFNKDLLPRLKMDEMVATLSLTGRSPTSTLQR